VRYWRLARQALPLAWNARPGRYGARRDRYGPVGCAGPRAQPAARSVAGWGGEACPPLRRSWVRRRGRLREGRRTLSDARIHGDQSQDRLPDGARGRCRCASHAEGRWCGHGHYGRLQPMPHTWVEEPTLAHDYAGNAMVAREARTPIQCGENWWGTLDMQHAIEARASDFVMLDVMKIGGVTGWLRAATLAQAKGLLVSNHLWPEISARLLCCTPTAHWLEYADWWNPILAEPLRVDKGMAIVDDAIGTGVDWNEDAVRRFAA